jgi:hypothetical protein
MIAYRVLSTAAVAAISLGIVFISPDLGQAQTGSQRGDQGQVHKATPRTDQSQARKSAQHATQGQVRKSAQSNRKDRNRTASKAPANKAPAQTGANDHDGSWSVSFRGGSGPCVGHAMSYVVQVHNGNISYSGGDGSGSGHVSPSGAVSFHVVSGDRSVNGSGHVSRSSGGGSWQGQATGGSCTGSWVASR